MNRETIIRSWKERVPAAGTNPSNPAGVRELERAEMQRVSAGRGTLNPYSCHTMNDCYSQILMTNCKWCS
ncbi:MAG: hypothetical protein HYX75_16340 [Acidobacteria bacterium]|nr:hypothetical protein [Acidobacteriota bacterium]